MFHIFFHVIYAGPQQTPLPVMQSLMLLTGTYTTADISIGPMRSFRDFVLLACPVASGASDMGLFHRIAGFEIDVPGDAIFCSSDFSE